MQPGFDFAAPHDPHDPSCCSGPCSYCDAQDRLRAAQAPFRGATPASAHASWTGARHAEETRSANIVALRQLWSLPRTINDVAAISGLPVSSVCSLKKALEAELIAIDHETIEWGAGRRSTKRTRWQLRTAAPATTKAERTR